MVAVDGDGDDLGQHLGKLDIPVSYTDIKFWRRSMYDKMEPFAWMVSELLPLVAGTRYWGKEKFTKCILFGDNKDCNGLLLVSVTDKALTLFMFENYFLKWLATWKYANKGIPNEVTTLFRGRSTLCPTRETLLTAGGQWMEYCDSMRYASKL